MFVPWHCHRFGFPPHTHSTYCALYPWFAASMMDDSTCKPGPTPVFILALAPPHRCLAATVMDEDAWREVTEFLVQVSSDIAPNAHDLLTPPGTSRTSTLGGLGQLGSAASLTSAASSVLSTSSFSRAGSTVPEIQPVLQGAPDQAAGANGGGNVGGWAAAATAAAAGGAPILQGQAGQDVAATSTPAGGARPFSLREGVGARRLAKFRSHATVQLLLVQGCSETYAGLHSVMPASATTRLLQVRAVGRS